MSSGCRTKLRPDDRATEVSKSGYSGPVPVRSCIFVQNNGVRLSLLENNINLPEMKDLTPLCLFFIDIQCMAPYTLFHKKKIPINEDLNMPNKNIVVFILMTIALLAAAPVVFAQNYSEWSAAYTGVQFQYVNQFGGEDWDGIRWRNGNSRKVTVQYRMQLQDGSTTDRVIYLGKNQTGATISIAEGERVTNITVKVG